MTQYATDLSRTRTASARARALARARARAAHGAGRRRLGVRPAVADDAAPPARPGLLVARRRAAAARRPRRASSSSARRPPARRRPRGGGAARCSRLPSTSTGCSRPGVLFLGLLLLWRRRSSGREVWRKPGLAGLPLAVAPLRARRLHVAGDGVLHELDDPHARPRSWAQVMMLAGAAELGLVSGKLKSEWWRLACRSRSRSPARRS